MQYCQWLQAHWQPVSCLAGDGLLLVWVSPGIANLLTQLRYWNYLLLLMVTIALVLHCGKCFSCPRCFQTTLIKKKIVKAEWGPIRYAVISHPSRVKFRENSFWEVLGLLEWGLSWVVKQFLTTSKDSLRLGFKVVRIEFKVRELEVQVCVWAASLIIFRSGISLIQV